MTRDDVRAFVADQLERWKPLTALNRYLRIDAGHPFAHLPNRWLGQAAAMTPSGLYQVAYPVARSFQDDSRIEMVSMLPELAEQLQR